MKHQTNTETAQPSKTGDEKYFSELRERAIRHRCWCGAATVAGSFCVRHDFTIRYNELILRRERIERQVAERFDRWAGLNGTPR